MTIGLITCALRVAQEDVPTIHKTYVTLLSTFFASIRITGPTRNLKYHHNGARAMYLRQVEVEVQLDLDQNQKNTTTKGPSVIND